MIYIYDRYVKIYLEKIKVEANIQITKELMDGFADEGGDGPNCPGHVCE